jgi:CRISPR/Cas system-associated exonuclease Cas4 (RecB family)
MIGAGDKMKISKSMLLIYDPKSRFGCPYRFYLQFNKGIHAEPTASMKRGIQFHEASARFFENVQVEKIKDKSFQSIYNYFRCLFPYRARMYDYLAALETDRFLVSEEHFKPILIESKIETSDRTGRVDRVELLDEGEMMIDELKASLKSKSSMGDVRFELAFYADLLRKNGYNIQYGSVFFGQSNRFEIFKLTDYDFLLMERRVQRLLNCIDAEEFEPVWDERKCMFCPKEIRTVCLSGEQEV